MSQMTHDVIKQPGPLCFRRERLHAEAAGISKTFFGHIPTAAWGIALLIAVVHMVPVWRAQAEAPPAWRFSGNLHRSPDFMQYRVWMNQPPAVFLKNKFAPEPHKPYIPAVFYSAIGEIGRRLDLPPEMVLQHSGAAFAFAMVLLLFATVRHFMKSAYQTWWVFSIILLGGGLGAHFILLEFLLQPLPPPGRLFASEATASTWVFFEHRRGTYACNILFDNHFLLIWPLTVAAIVSFYFAIRETTIWRVMLAMFLFAMVPLLHLYQGVLLNLIIGMVLLLCWRKALLNRAMLACGLACAATCSAVLGSLLLVYKSSGLPIPPWREHAIQVAILFVAYPIGWVIVLRGLPQYWERARLSDCFLLGWLLTCTGLTLSFPFYQYGGRGTMTLLVPLYIVAGLIFFSRFRTVPLWAAVLAVAVLGLTPAREFWVYWKGAGFDETANHVFVSDAHQEIADSLKREADDDDILLAHEEELLWLAPEYPGKHYCGHFFLTVNYRKKKEEVALFFESAPKKQADFLADKQIRFLFVDSDHHTEELSHVPGLVCRIKNSAGTLFEFTD